MTSPSADGHGHAVAKPGSFGEEHSSYGAKAKAGLLLPQPQEEAEVIPQ